MTRTADTNWKPATSILQYRIEIILAVDPNRPVWSEGVGYYYVVDSNTREVFKRRPSQVKRDLFWYTNLDDAILICDAVNSRGQWRDSRSRTPPVARVVAYTEQTTRGVVHEPPVPEPDPIDDIPDEKIRELLSAKDVGSGRARLRSLIKEMKLS